MRVRLLLVDSHEAFLTALSRFLQSQEAIEVVGQADTGPATVELTRQVKPDIVLMDIDISGLPTMGPVRQIRRDQPGVKIILWSIDPLPPRVREIVKASVNGYLLKDADPEVLLAAVRTVAVGGTYMSAESNGRPQGHFKQGT